MRFAKNRLTATQNHVRFRGRREAPHGRRGPGEGAGGRPLRRRDPAPQAYPAPTLHPPCTHLALTLHLPCTYPAPGPRRRRHQRAPGARGGAGTERLPCAHPAPTYPAPTLHPVASLGPARHAHPHRRPTLHLPCTRPPPARATKLTFCFTG